MTARLYTFSRTGLSRTRISEPYQNAINDDRIKNIKLVIYLNIYRTIIGPTGIPSRKDNGPI